MANLVTNMSVQKCADAASTYTVSLLCESVVTEFLILTINQACVTYAIEQLATVGVYMYLDAGHAGWLGWPANLSPAAQLFANMYSTTGKSPFFRGLATSESIHALRETRLTMYSRRC